MNKEAMSAVDEDLLMESSWGLKKAKCPTASPSSSPIGLLDGEAVGLNGGVIIRL
jgi:hypothetical protein